MPAMIPAETLRERDTVYPEITTDGGERPMPSGRVTRIITAVDTYGNERIVVTVNDSYSVVYMPSQDVFATSEAERATTR